MNVLHLTTHLDTGGITRYIFNLAEEWHQKKGQVYIVSSGGEWEKKFQSIGVELFSIPLRIKFEGHPFVFISAFKVFSFLKQKKIDVIHAHTRVSQVLAGIVSKWSGIPYVTTCHGFYKNRLGRRLYPAWGDRVIAISPSVQRQLEISFRVPQEKIDLVFNGINLKELKKTAAQVQIDQEKKEWKLENSFPVVGVVSRFSVEKGISLLIEAVALLKQKYPKIRVILAGQGKEEQNLRDLVNQKGLQSHVVWMGVMKNIALPFLLMDYFVLPVIGPEGFGFVVTEAMAFKKPIIVSDIENLNVLIQDKKNGLVFPVGDVAALAKQIEYFVQHPEVAAQFAAEAQVQVHQKYSAFQMAEKIKQVYERVLKCA